VTQPVRQCFAWWSFALGRDDDPALLDAAAAIGYRGVEMVPEALWPRVRDAGLSIVTDSAHDIDVGFNDPANHSMLRERVGRAIDRAAEAEIEALIVFAGRRDGRSDDDGIAACIDGLGPVAERAADAGVRLLLEILNSKVDHPDHHCDRSAWAFSVARGVGSSALAVLFDAYHVQLMEGDLSRTMKANIDLIGHVHTAGVPGRRDLDDRQEVSWTGIAGLLDHLGYDRWIGHELIPRGDPVDALRHAHSLFA
jgi:hydroxypyruvate isomerase